MLRSAVSSILANRKFANLSLISKREVSYFLFALFSLVILRIGLGTRES